MFKLVKFQMRLALLSLLLLATSYLCQDADSGAAVANPYCIKGCLRCDPVTKICSICDVSLGYIPTINGKGCEIGVDENCVLKGRFNYFFPSLLFF